MYTVLKTVEVPEDAFLYTMPPMAPKRVRQEKYPFSRLTLEASFFVPGKTARDMRGAIWGATQRYGHKYVARSTETGVRVWRVV